MQLFWIVHYILNFAHRTNDKYTAPILTRCRSTTNTHQPTNRIEVNEFQKDETTSKMTCKCKSLCRTHRTKWAHKTEENRDTANDEYLSTTVDCIESRILCSTPFLLDVTLILCIESNSSADTLRQHFHWS